MSSGRRIVHIVLAAVAAFALSTAQPLLAQTTAWRELSPTTPPLARDFPAMAYDPVSQKIVLFGGLGPNGNLNDTWTFDGTTWTQVTSAVAPPVRNGAAMVFDQPTNKLVMFGGFDVKFYLQDTWVFDGATMTWTEAQMNLSPPRATGAVLFTDPLTGSAIMFGGYNSNNKVPAYSRTWRWTGTSWQELFPHTAPYPRGWGIATLDPPHHNVVLTAGNGDTIRTDNTWTWDGTDWTLQNPTTQIPAYVGAGIAFDPAMQKVVAFGILGDTWSWTGSDWVQLAPAFSPSARSAVGMAYDPATDQAIIFGGQLGNGILSNSTWQFVGR